MQISQLKGVAVREDALGLNLRATTPVKVPSSRYNRIINWIKWGTSINSLWLDFCPFAFGKLRFKGFY